MCECVCVCVCVCARARAYVTTHIRGAYLLEESTQEYGHPLNGHLHWMNRRHNLVQPLHGNKAPGTGVVKEEGEFGRAMPRGRAKSPGMTLHAKQSLHKEHPVCAPQQTIPHVEARAE